MPRPSPGQQIINGALVRLFADTTPGSAAEVAYEALQEEVDELLAEVRALRQKLDAKSLVECRCRFLVQPRILILELIKRIVYSESDLGFWEGLLPAVSLTFRSARALTPTQILITP